MADLKTDVVEPPREPKGDCSELEKAAKLEEAKAEEEVVVAFSGDSPSFGLAEERDPNDETADVFEKALLIGLCKRHQQCIFLSKRGWRRTLASAAESLS